MPNFGLFKAPISDAALGLGFKNWQTGLDFLVFNKTGMVQLKTKRFSMKTETSYCNKMILAGFFDLLTSFYQFWKPSRFLNPGLLVSMDAAGAMMPVANLFQVRRVVCHAGAEAQPSCWQFHVGCGRGREGPSRRQRKPMSAEPVSRSAFCRA
jgi:hypothetical protein